MKPRGIWSVVQTLLVVLAGIVVLTVFALLLDALVGVVERRLMKWQPKGGETEKL